MSRRNLFDSLGIRFWDQICFRFFRIARYRISPSIRLSLPPLVVMQPLSRISLGVCQPTTFFRLFSLSPTASGGAYNSFFSLVSLPFGLCPLHAVV